MFWLEQFLHLNRYDLFALTLTVVALALLKGFLKLNKKKKFISPKWLRLLIPIYIFPILLGLYAFFVEPNLLMVREYHFDAPQVQLQKPIRLVVIGDMQERAEFAPSFVSHVVKVVNQQNPDYIIWVGDLIEDQTRVLPLFNSFGDLQAKYGKFAVLGNHDYRDFMGDPVNQQMAKDVEAFLDAQGLTVLRNEAITTDMDGQPVTFAGTEDLWSDLVDFQPINKQVATVSGSLNFLVAHQPMTVIKNDRPDLYALTLAGHCHGGQLNLLFLNGLLNRYKLPPGCFRNPAEVSGLFHEAEHDIFVTPGVGSLKVRARFLSPPEVSVVNVY